MTDTIEVSGGRVVTITIGKPYSLVPSFLHSLLTALAETVRSSTRVLVLTTAHPDALLADVAALAAMSPNEAFNFSELGQRVCTAIESLPFPVITAIDGLALGGGCELTLASDLVFASERAQFGPIEIHGGVIPGFGGTWRLCRRVGELKAREMLYTGAVLDAQSAKSTGLITDVFESTEFLNKVSGVATSIAALAPLAVRAAKTMVLSNRDTSLHASNNLERQIFSSLFRTADQKEGMSAFLEKRPAMFVGA